MYYSEDLIEEIRSRNDIVDVISGYVKLQKKGSSYFGLCPFHNEKSPSFSVSGQKQMYYCFGCGAGGNVFTFLMEYENYSFQDAVKVLAQRAGVQLPQEEETPQQKKEASLRQKLLDIHKLAARYFYYQLTQPQGRQAMEYLSGRKLTHDTIVKFGLGYSNKFRDDLYRYLRSQGYDDYILKESGLITLDEKHGGSDKFWNRVMFPIMDINNRVIGFGGRVLGDGNPKYLNSPETKLFDKSRNLYGLNLARRSRRPNMIICEGYMDVISMHQAGFDNAVASLGTAFTSPQASLLKRYTDEVLLAYDSDGAGVKAALRAIPMLRDAGLRSRVIDMKPYKDPDEFIKNLGTEAFEERIAGAMNSFMFEISVLEKNYDLNDPEGKTGFFNETARKLLEFDQALERKNYIEAVARNYGISFDDLDRLVNRYGLAGYGQENKTSHSGAGVESVKQKKTQKDDALVTAQKLLLTWLSEDTRLFEKIRPWIGPGDFTDPLCREAAAKVFEEYEEKKTVTPARIMNLFQDPQEHDAIARAFNTNIDDEGDKAVREKALNETVRRVKAASLENAGKSARDLEALQSIVREKRSLLNLHISL
ncbi:DNA primase [Catenibacillus scindens]|uniref:DNA primase n=1 Tax=Catenibacillus scindens TaxID=673271 RepID=A0A7W8H9W7_9FIRM|nr:DNA primase [Catenibacillus scindens]MBB5263847.1 DNA primase [Catenibacillus scindens]